MIGRYRANILFYYLFTSLNGVAGATSVVLWVIFLQQRNGFSLTQVALLDVAFWLSRFVFEVPTGIIADRQGRKVSLALGAGLSSIVWLVFALGHEFWVIAVAQVVGGLAATLYSGAAEALLFESVRAAGREGEYARLTGRATAIGSASILFASPLAGIAGSHDLTLPVLVSSGLLALTLIPVLLMTETGGDAAAGAGAPRSYTYILRQALAVLRAGAALRWAIGYLVVLSCIGFYSAMFLQPYAVAIGVPIAGLGLVMAGLQLTTIAGALAVPGLQRTLGTRKVLVGVPILLIPCMLAIGALPGMPALLPVAVSGFLFALPQPMLLALIQRRVPDETRATLLSVQPLVAMVFLVVTEPPLGALSDLRGVHTAYLAMAGALLLFAVVLLSQRQGKIWEEGQSVASPG